jgi:iron complex transport system permease protein
VSAASTTPTAAPTRKGIRIGPVGLAWRPRVLTTSVVAVVAALLLVVLGVAIGSTFIAPGTVVRALLGLESGPESFIVTTLRLPRVLTGALVGVTLAVAGALTQTFTRNPLGTPDIIGVTSGASVGAVAATGMPPPSSTAWAGVAGCRATV